MVEGAFPNKYPGPCFYCARRVPAGQWGWRDGATFVVAHTTCMAEHCADGHPPQVTGAGKAAHLVRDVRKALSRVRLDSPMVEIEAAADAVRRIVMERTSIVPF